MKGGLAINFGETLAYWYLRLNGFFPILNFVLHRHDGGVKYSTDADLLAVRHPHVYEVVGGHKDDWDVTQFENWGINLGDEIIGLIVQVKTGRHLTQRDIVRAFNLESLIYGIHRLGIIPPDQVYKVSKELLPLAIYRPPEGKIVIGKLLITDYILRIDCVKPYLLLSLREADEFILRRMKSYIDPKSSGRMFFPSDLMQYIIWKSAQDNCLKDGGD